MKNKLLFMCMVAIALTACHKPEPEPNNDNPADTTETVVKKYLVKQLLNDDPEKIMLAIDWNDDFTRILHVKYGLGYGSCIDYDFEYYNNNDSIQVTWSVEDDFSTWSFWYDRIMIHMREKKVDSICCYAKGELRDVEHYFYDENGKLLKRTYFDNAVSDDFRWDGDNVVEYKIMEDNSFVAFDTFTNYTHPHYTLPFYLSTEVAFEIRQPLFYPLWKHQPVHPLYKKYEADEDGYITKMTHKDSSDSLEKCITFYYEPVK